MSRSSGWCSDMKVICVTCGVEFGEHYGDGNEYECPIPDPKNVGHYIRNCNGQPMRWWVHPNDAAKKLVAKVATEQASTAPAVNDHICPTCKNDRCSKREKSCWKCGNKL